MNKTILGLIVMMLFLSYSNAQTGEPELYNELGKSEKKLDSIFNELKESLQDIDRNALIISQKDWLNFKDSNCIFKSLKNSEGGVIANKMYLDCKIQTTRIRLRELKDLLENGF